MRQWTLPLVLGAAGLVALAAGFGASGATATSLHPASSGGQGGGAGCERLMSDPAAVKAMQSLRAEHVKDMQAWHARYGTDPQMDEAQAALKAMREEHVREMRAAFKEFGIEVHTGACGAGMMNGDHSGMMGGPADGGAGTF